MHPCGLFQHGSVRPDPAARARDPPILPDPAGDVLGTGPVRVALLLPLTGDQSLSTVGTSMANSARIAMQYISGNAALPDNITIVIKDTGPTAAGAAGGGEPGDPPKAPA